MSIYEQAMQDQQFRKIVLVQFGFGEHVPVKVERFLKKNYPYKVAEWRKQAASQKVVPMVAEGMSKGQRDKILDKEEAYSKFFQGEN